MNYTFLSADAIDLCSKLLNKNPLERLGSQPNGIQQIMQHPWFQDIDWNLMQAKKMKAPYVPQLDNECDVKYFD